VPFGAVPSKLERFAVPDAVGAGAGKTSPANQFAGLKEPLVIGVSSGSWLEASSSSVRLLPARPNSPPASEMTVAFVLPAGAASRMSTSSGQGCVRPLMVRSTSVIVPVRPLTTQVDG
jgi:hypothetical protein